MRKSLQIFVQPIIALLDVLLVNTGMLIAFLLRFGTDMQFHGRNFQAYTRIAGWLSLSSIAVFFVSDMYTDWLRRSQMNILHLLCIAVAVQNFVTIALTFWARSFAFPRLVLLIAPPLQLLLLIAFRLTVWNIHHRLRGSHRLLIFGAEHVDGEVKEKIKRTAHWFTHCRVLPEDRMADLPALMHEFDTVLIPSTIASKSDVIAVCADAGKEVLVVPGSFELFMSRAKPRQIDDVLVLCVTLPSLKPAQRLFKRVFDVLGSTILLLIASPVMLLLSVVIPLTSNGPALFKQDRLGYRAKRYKLLKFRTMLTDAEKLTGPVLAWENDQRITRLGHFLRSSRLDELPQLFNVIWGDMSLIGPRPERAFFVDQFQTTIPSYNFRMLVRPGITGLAQVFGRYDTRPQDKLQLDLMYLSNYSLILDIKIIFQTVRVVLQHDGGGRRAKDLELPNVITKKQVA